MRFSTLFFDLDDTLYPASTGLWHAIKERMNMFMHERLCLPEAEIPALREQYFKTYGTTLRGLQQKAWRASACFHRRRSRRSSRS